MDCRFFFVPVCVTQFDNDIFLKGSSMVTFSLWHSMSHLRFVEGICQCDRTHKTHLLLQEAWNGGINQSSHGWGVFFMSADKLTIQSWNRLEGDLKPVYF